MFITLEGGEGAGKTSVALELKAFLEAQGRIVLLTREPGGCALSEEVRALLLNKPTLIYPKAELLLFLAARVQHMEEEILPALSQGAVVICDRFHDSTIAYQGFGRGLPNVESLCLQACGALQPDLTLFLDVPVELGLKRAAQRRGTDDRIGQEKSAFHERVREGFLALAKENPKRIVTIDASKPLSVVVAHAKDAVGKRL